MSTTDAVDDGAARAPDTGRTGRVADAVTANAGWVLIATALITVLAMGALLDFKSGGTRLRVDPSLDPLVSQDSPDRQYDDLVRLRFGHEETVLVVLQTENAYSLPSLQRLDRLTNKLRALPGVEGVTSLTSVQLAEVTDEGVHVQRVDPDELNDPELPARLRARVADNPLLRGSLVSADGRSTSLAIGLARMTDREMLERGIAAQITEVAKSEEGYGVEVWVTGAPVIRAETSASVLRQLQWAVPAIIVLLTGVLALAFRSRRGVLLPLATIVLSLSWTMAILCLMDRPLNLITSLVPPLLVTMGLAYCAHVLSEFETLLRSHLKMGRRALAALLLREVAAPVLLTGVCTCVGLLALAFTNLPAIREFAWLSALGVLFCMVLVLTFVPAALCYSGREAVGALPGAELFENGSAALGRFDTRNRRGILIVAGIVLVLAGFASTNIRIGDQFVGIFPPESMVRTDYEAVNKAIGGVNPMAIALDAENADAFTDPILLRAMNNLQEWLRNQPEVGSVNGLPDHIKLLHRLFVDPTTESIPSSRDLARQLLFFGDGPELQSVVNSDRSSSLITMRLRVDDTHDISALMERMKPELEKLPGNVKANITGNSALLANSVANVTTDQMQSIGLALLLIYLCLAVQFASFSIAFKASLPTTLQTAIYFGALGVSGVSLNATTSLVECLVLGLAVDDTIHYLARFNKAAKQTGSETQGSVIALRGVLRPVTLTKAILALGFLVLVTGELQNQVLFGWLAAFTLLAAWLVDVFVTPAFMSGVRVVTLWDSLLLNLGRDPQSTIPVFSGLSARQARIFALMSNMQTVPAGTRLITEGDPGGDIYVIIDGDISVWLERDHHRVDIDTLGRGAVIGEAGYFGQKRTANVDTLSQVRLLRFNEVDRERICKRYPGIAARVFLNLNKIQAERVAKHMQQGY